MSKYVMEENKGEFFIFDDDAFYCCAGPYLDDLEREL